MLDSKGLSAPHDREPAFHFIAGDISSAFSYMRDRGAALVGEITDGVFFNFKDPDGLLMVANIRRLPGQKEFPMREAINEGYKAAMKSGDKRRTATLRSINAAIKDKDIEARGQGKGLLTDAEILPLLQKMVKQREESLAIYTDAGRVDLATVEREEIAILSEFLPKGLSDVEIDAAIREAIAKTGAAGGKDMGKVIASLKADYPGRIDFGKASAKVKAALG